MNHKQPNHDGLYPLLVQATIRTLLTIAGILLLLIALFGGLFL